MKKIFLFCGLCLVLFAVIAPSARPDTVITNNNKEIKGIVVEDYKDRYVFSTPDGEIIVMKSDIKEMYFDSEEDNLIKLAEQAKERRDYIKSYNYYNMAFKLNPASRVAKDGLVFLQGYLYRMEESVKQDAIKRQEEFERYGSAVKTVKSEDAREQELVDKLRSTAGMTLVINDRLPIVENVVRGSPAYEAGVLKGDAIVAVWGRLCGYMSLTDVIELLIEKSSLEIKCVIQRNVNVVINPAGGPMSKPGDIIDASLGMEFDGLTISGVAEPGRAFTAGLKKGDLIISVAGKATRYMPLKKAVEIMRNEKSGSATLTINRDIIIWRKL